MTTYTYIKTELTEDRFRQMIKGGLISSKIAVYYQVYEWHINNGRSEAKTAEHFRMPKSSVSYARQQMKKEI